MSTIFLLACLDCVKMLASAGLFFISLFNFKSYFRKRIKSIQYDVCIFTDIQVPKVNRIHIQCKVVMSEVNIDETQIMMNEINMD